MSDEPKTTTTTIATEASQTGPDDTEPTAERQAELRAAYDANVVAGKAPYAGVPIRTRGELSWVMLERRWQSGMLFVQGNERVDLRLADLSDSTLSGAVLFCANLSEANLMNADLSGVRLANATLSGTNLVGANLSGADLTNANLSGTVLRLATLSGTSLVATNLSGADLAFTALSRGADLRRARMDVTTVLQDTSLDTQTLLADVVWNGAPLTRLNWEDVTTLGEEEVARQAKDREGKRKDTTTRLIEFGNAVLANRQVATVLRSQGLNEHADRFAYRAQLCQRRLLRMQRHYLRYLGSLFLGLISGYGYRPLRSVATYVIVIFAFASAYLLNAQFAAPHLSWDEALVLSISAFHGRGFFTSGISLGDTLARLAAGEAIMGLLIEITFIATFTQRFFAR
jgi:hypothetical protein